MQRTLSVFAIFAAALLALFAIGRAAGANPTPDEEAVRQAIQSAIAAQNEVVLDFLLYEESIEQIRFSADDRLARASLISLDPATGQPIEQEPGLAFARRDGQSWVAILPADPGWLEAVHNAPVEILADEERDYWLATYDAALDERPTAAIGGFYLPWAPGETKYVTQSVGHDEYTPSGTMHYAFDFALNRTHWPIHAARPGEVWMCKEDVPTCDEWTCSGEQKIGNYIVIKDAATTPTTYHLYLHLDHESIPDNLCVDGEPVPGAQVSQSQVIGVVDNTGQSWGAHLHFQVHTRSYHYFGTAIDILFQDVHINEDTPGGGGRPRRQEFDEDYCKPEDVCDEFQVYYVSGNIGSDDDVDPTGDITNLSDGATITTATLPLQGQAADLGDGVDSVQFLAYFQDAWRAIGAPVTVNPEAAALNWDWCASNIPDGIVSVAMRVTDRANNTNAFTGLHHVIKSYVCPQPPPACEPAANQVALFSDPGYAGSCARFNVGTHTNLGAVGNNNAASLRVGPDVKATLHDSAAPNQRGETFRLDDSNLVDNWIGLNTVSALVVQLDGAPPAAALPRLPAEAATLTAGDMLAFGWDNGNGAIEYQVVITDATHTYTSPWLTTPYSFTADLPAGSYTWRVYTGGSAWSTPRHFTITPAPALTTTLLTVPFTHTFEGSAQGWSASGLWMHTVADNRTAGDSWSWWYRQLDGDYDNGAANFGSLTSLPIAIPSSGGPYYLRFYTKSETESPYRFWDQRWLQVSVNGGPFANLWQAVDDPAGLWLGSPAFDLTPYAGQSIRLRFYFHTMDALRNANDGWGIDDLAITTTPPPTCPADGGTLTYGNSQNGTICPNGDVDEYTFTGSVGDEIGINVDAVAGDPESGPVLDPLLTLLDWRGNVLAENDDQVTELNRDPLIRYRLRESGIYTLRVRAWDHPSAGGTDYAYTVRLFQDATRPAVNLTYPVSNSDLPAGIVQLSATASDVGSGMESVAFYWHSSDWLNGAWQFVGVDADGSNGWSVPFDTRQSDQPGVAVYARAFDQAGNEAVSAAWNILLDHTPPTSQLDPWNATLGSNAILLNWTGSDNLSGLQRFDLQQKIDNAAWTDHLTFTATTRQSWLVLPTGSSAVTYGYRLRALDQAGNAEAWPSAPEVSATLPGLSDLCAAPDAWEPNNTPLSATLVLSGTTQEHHFCNPLAADFANDEDWLQMAVSAGQGYLVSVTPLDQSVAVTIEVYASDGSTLLAGPIAVQEFGHPAAITWAAPADGVNYIRLRHTNPAILGNATRYQVQAGEAQWVFLPVISR